MRKELLFAFAAFFILSLNALAGNFVQEEDENNALVIDTYEVDVTGNGKPDKIVLWGKPFPDALYYNKVWSEIITDDKKSFQIDYEGGYEPKIEFIDFNHDGVKDLLQSSAAGGSGGLYHFTLYTLANNTLTDIGLPESLTIQAHFEDNYKASITFEDTNQSYTVDLSDRKEEYNRLGLYHNGRLNEPTELMVVPYAFFEPVKIKGKEGYGLKGNQQISGAYHADGIGFAASYWYYENGKWVLQKIVWEETSAKEE
ncbi:hypothetical protein JOC86_000446 [Bacillus pakistanensis]|uniref:VCBS repeat-containing protein n=1 Tax=Rossellomorea pakistanensis TaxID=992288 RepID=A0ABS2N823_9BACI|nr:hypothetical protein [Bacillus pakistanensis]MBM7583909.1 hypothetical protein [Bacillus pakistanensis]